jgi:hypothetical protein
MAIKIIGAGFPRTGTNTLKCALEIIGISKSYHFKDLLLNPENLHYWETLAQTGNTNWEEIYEGYEASVDFPCYPWYKEHMKQYPDAKVILTVRPFDKWYTSVKSTIWTAGPQSISEKISMLIKLPFDPHLRKVIKCIKFVKGFLWEKQFQGRFLDKEFVESIWNQHIEEVIAYVPKEKLLVYDVRNGWAPLCEFLGIPEPAEAFPHLNKKENFKTMLQKLIKGVPA